MDNPSVFQELAQTWWATLSVLILGLTQLIKAALPENVSKKFSPHIAALLGVGFGYFLIEQGAQGIVTGLMVGLGAAGLWSSAVSPFKK